MSERVKILVVDDEEVVLQSVRKVLKSDDEHEFLVDTALSATEGIELVSANDYDIVVTDLMMPGMDGLEFIDGIRERKPSIRIIMITGYATMRTALQALRKGAFEYVAKPFRREELRSVVKKAADHTAEAAPAGADVADEGDCRSFFNQTYARLLPDGSVHFGVEKAYVNAIGEPLSIEVVREGERVTQGYPFGSITNADMRVFTLRSPLSGCVLKVNDEAVDSALLIKDDPRGKGWLLQIEPSDFEAEVENLGG
jgi:CheY-like chemotaxis protein/glycine cleavage system H lipoate-binding protein